MQCLSDISVNDELYITELIQQILPNISQQHTDLFQLNFKSSKTLMNHSQYLKET